MPGGPDEWLEIVKQCKPLPEPDIKKLCEMVKTFAISSIGGAPRCYLVSKTT